MCVCCVSSVLLHLLPVSGWFPKQAFFGDKHYLCCCCLFVFLFKMQISNTYCSLTRTAHSWDTDSSIFRFSVDSMKQNFRFDYFFFNISHKKWSFFSRFIYSIYSYHLQPEWVHLAVDVKDQMKLISAGVCSLKCQHWLWGKLLKSTSIIMTWGNTLMNKISNCALSV